MKLISDIRSARAELNVPAGAKLKLLVVGANDTTRKRLDVHRAAIERLARIEGIEAAAAAPKAALQIVVGEATYALPVGDVIDLKAEGARLQKEIKKLADEIGKIDAKLGNANFVSRAPEEVVEEQRERRAQAEQTRARLSTALERLELSSADRGSRLVMSGLEAASEARTPCAGPARRAATRSAPGCRRWRSAGRRGGWRRRRPSRAARSSGRRS